MKHNIIIKSLLFGILAGLFISSCTEDAIDELTGKYPAPEVYAFTKLASESSEKQDNKRIFTIDFATDGVTGSNGQYSGSGSVLSVQFVGDTYYLHAAAFSAAAEASAKKGNFIAGYGTNSGTCFYDVSGGSVAPSPVTSGTLTVGKDGDNYTLSGVIWLADGEAIKVNYSGVIVYEADPEPVALSQVLYATLTDQGNGTNLITLKLATQGVVVIPGEWGDSYGGDGNYLSVDFVSSDASLAAGTYTPAANDSAADGNYVQGYDTEMWGMTFYNWGTCWFTMASNVESGAHITTGNIEVAKSGSTYTITINNGEIFAQYKGQIEALGGGDDNAIEMNNLFSASVNGNVMTLKIADSNITPTYNDATWSWEYAGTGNHISIDIYTADGTLAAGTYTAVDNTELGPFNFSKGYDTEMWGMQFYNWGTCWFDVVDGVETGQHLTEGTITVTESGGQYTISGDFGSVQMKYTGAIVIQ